MLPDPDRSRVVLIGASRFTDPELPDLPAVRNNLDGLAACLRDIGRCTVVADPSSPVDLVDPIHDAAAEAEDTLLIYYAGHGLVHPRTLGLLLAVVGSAPGRTHTAVPYDLVRENVLESPATRKVVILDCCYSGRALGGMADPTTAVANEAIVEGTYLLASAPPNKQALAPPGETHTAFTGALLTLLTEGVPNGPDHLQLDLIYRHVRDALKRAARPEPQLRTDNTAGELALIRNPWYQPPAILRPFEPIPGIPIIDFSPAKRDVRGRLKELLRESGSHFPYACPVCDTTVSGENLVRHFDKHAPTETASLNPATLTLTPRPNLLHDRYQLGKPVKLSDNVRRAIDTVTGSPVLVKELPSDQVDDRWHRLAHRGIVPVLDLLPSHVVLKNVDGRTAADMLVSFGPMEPERAMEITIEVCGILDYVHRQGAVHGDLSTRNLILTRNDSVALLTFGPGQPVDPGSDLYDAARLLVELLTGQSVATYLLGTFTGSDGVDVPLALDTVVRKALHSEPAERYQTAAALRAALRDVLNG